MFIYISIIIIIESLQQQCMASNSYAMTVWCLGPFLPGSPLLSPLGGAQEVRVRAGLGGSRLHVGVSGWQGPPAAGGSE